MKHTIVLWVAVLMLSLLAACRNNTVPEPQAVASPTPEDTPTAVAEAVDEASATNTPTIVPDPTATATLVIQPTEPGAEPVEEATPTEVAGPSLADTPTPTVEVVNWLDVEGQTDSGQYYLGNPDAPVTMIDYSDFL